jgi:phosphatidylglycerophosphatase A
MKNILYFIVSLGGVGFIKPASATWGSLASAIALFFIFPNIEIISKLLILLLTLLIGWYAANKIENITKLKDPHFIVIDELVGMMITTVFLGPIWWHFFIAFIVFRIFDIAKLWPASIFDRRPGGFAVMFDDVIMATPSLAIVHLILKYV